MVVSLYAAALAFNLSVDGLESSEHDVVQAVAATLADALRRSPSQHRQDFQYEALAELARYGRAEVSLDDPRYKAAMGKLEELDRRRSALNFTLVDLRGKSWSLKSLNGKVVLVNFWATWCPPCQREFQDLSGVYRRFQNQGLVILAMSDEEASIVRSFVERENLSFPVLLDPRHTIRDEFRVSGLPVSFIYDRAGRLVATKSDRPPMSEWIQLLGLAGLH